MKIQNMFLRDINRPISGVIIVDQEDGVRQELEEYIVTKELRRHFSTFFENYSKAISQPTNQIGVWISGFFGSGKSHFLKMLSYLLTNREVAGKKTVDYFKEKFDDAMTYATVVQCTNIPTESILFNIDVAGPMNKDKTAVLRVFTKMFYNHLGFYGEDLKVAKLERYLEKQGKTDEFRQIFEEIHGDSWVESRSTYAFIEDDIVAVLQKVLDMSEIAARNWFSNEENTEMSIKQLVEEIQEYVDSKGDNFRLLFCVDEVGQYIGDDSDLMINLQSIVEELGAKCRGKVWVMVTSQEAIDSVVKITGDDFSKIQGRFNTRLSLSSASVDEVIKKRILEKTEDADAALRMQYEKDHAVLKNLFTFSEAVQDIKGFSDAAEFSATFPFVPYQFIIIQKVLTEIRIHGNAGKHLSGGERSMLSAFQEAAQKVKEKDSRTLVPFWRFYDTVHTFLESQIRRVIDRCQTAADQRDGIEQIDVDVLKLLYLVRYIDDVKANIDNIAILMIDDVGTDKIDLRKNIAASLERLVHQNYVARQGDTYSFLTDEEQDIAIDIRNTAIDSANIVQSIGRTIFSEIYPSRKYKYNKYDFAYDQYVDEMILGQTTGGVRLRFITAAGEYYNAPEQKYVLDSKTNNEAIIILSRDAQYFEELETAAKIRKFIKQKNVSQLPLSIQEIIRKRQAEASALENSAKDQIAAAISSGDFYICGEKVEIKYGDVKAKLDEAMKQLIENVYFALNDVNQFSESDADIIAILNDNQSEQGRFIGAGANNESAIHDISQWLEGRHQSRVPVSMGDVQRRYQAIPYGWREIDIAAMIARLIVSQKIEIRYGGAVVDKHDKDIVRYLRVRSEIDKVSVQRRIAPSEELMRKTIIFLRDWLGRMSIPEDEDGLIAYVMDVLTKKEEQYSGYLKEYNRDRYPEEEVVINAKKVIDNILSQKNNNVALLNCLIQKQDELRDATEDLEVIGTFFESQREIFDSARKLQASIVNERDYFVSDPTTNMRVKEIASILGSAKPYDRIKELPELMQEIKASYTKLLERKKEEVQAIIIQYMGEIHTIAGDDREARIESNSADRRFDEYKKEAAAAESLTSIDAMIRRIQLFSDSVLKRIHEILSMDGGNRVIHLRRVDVVSPRRLTTKVEIDDYVDGIREYLYKALADNDGVQIN